MACVYPHRITLRGSCGKLDAQPIPPYEGDMVKIRPWVNSGHWIRKHVNVLGTCGELDAFVSIPDEGDMTFLHKKGKSGAAVGKLVLLQGSISTRCDGYIGGFDGHTVMSDSEESGITYTAVSSPYKDLSDIAEDASPTAQSPDYVPESDPEADPRRMNDEDPEEDPIDYPADGGDDGDDEMDIEEEEMDDMDIGAEPLRLRNYLLYLPPPASPLSPWSSSPPQIPFPLSPPSPVLSAPPPSPIRSLGYRAAMIRMRAEAAATSHSLPLPPPFILSPTRPDAPPPMPTSAPTSLPPLLLPSASHREDRPEVNLPPRERLGIALGPGYEVGESSAAAAARPAGGLRADYGFVATMDREIRRDPERYVGYGITDSWDEIVETLQGAPVSTDTELGAHVREFESMVRRDTDEIYTMLDDEQSQRQLLAGRVNILFRDRRAHAHTRLLMETEARMSREAWGRSMDASDLARAEVMSLRTTVHAQMTEITELQSADRSRRRAISDLLETDRGRREEMRELRAADRTRQQQIIQTLTVMQTLQREMIPLQGLVTTLQGQVTALQGQVMALQGQVTALQGQQGPAGGPAQPELPEEAGSSS
ncbi:hypothetical protein Tco_0689371 [Tanacetum coccineum]